MDVTPPARNPQPRLHAHEVPDLQTQYEALLDLVWKREAEWRWEERIDQVIRLYRER